MQPWSLSSGEPQPSCASIFSSKRYGGREKALIGGRDSLPPFLLNGGVLRHSEVALRSSRHYRPAAVGIPFRGLLILAVGFAGCEEKCIVYRAYSQPPSLKMTLNEYMKRNQMSDDWLAKRVQRSRAHVTRLRNGARPSLELAVMIAKITDDHVRPEDFVNGTQRSRYRHR